MIVQDASDEDLMLAYARGSDAAFRALFQRYAAVLLRVLQRNVGRTPDAHDLVQQTFLQLHRARHDFQGDRRFRPWIFTIALNLARDLLRRKGRRPEVVVEEHELPPGLAVQPTVNDGSADDLNRRLRAALGELPREQREVIELHWFENLSYTEIASIVGASSGAARVRAHRAYAVLRKALDPSGTGLPSEMV